MPDGPQAEEKLDFVPVLKDGRINVELHSLYSTKQTGAGGPAAAVVRYLPGATASAHVHPGFELIYVLSGELETEDGVYGPDSLLVMSPGSRHAPRSPKGCVGLAVWEQPVVAVEQAPGAGALTRSEDASAAPVVLGP
jgi:quercetin dioxygenase-like cupin family protein